MDGFFPYFKMNLSLIKFDYFQFNFIFVLDATIMSSSTLDLQIHQKIFITDLAQFNSQSQNFIFMTFMIVIFPNSLVYD